MKYCELTGKLSAFPAVAVAFSVFGLAGCGPLEITGSPTADTIEVGAKDARVFAGDGGDSVAGGPQADQLDGNAGNDLLDGRQGDDVLHGGRGDDTIRGEDGDDLLTGDRGLNLLFGGAGRDRFILAPLEGRDVVGDFDGDEGDRVFVQGDLKLAVQTEAPDVILRLEDGSQMRLSGVAGRWADAWIVRQPRPHSWPRLVQDRSVMGALIIAMMAVLGVAAALLNRFRARGKRKALEAKLRRSIPAARPESGGLDNHGGLAERLPHARDRNLGLDAVRAAAILMVLVSHWSSAMLPWFGRQPPEKTWFLGELGVVLFFSLSGFLIGQILIEQAGLDASWRNFRIFMIRRWMRTLPLYFLVLAILLIFAPPADRLLYGLRYGTLTQNVLGPMPPGGFFAVTWSLTVEEWFYLLFGAAVFASFRLLRRPWAVWPVLVVFLLAPLVLRVWFPQTPEGIARLNQIACGAAMAQLYRSDAALFRRPMTCLAAGIMLLTAVWWRLPVIPSAYLLMLTSIGCCLLIPAAMQLTLRWGWPSRIIEAVSAMAYPLYLIHLDLMVAVAVVLLNPHRVPAWLCVGIVITAPFALAYLSFRFFEAPILRLRPKHPTWGGMRPIGSEGMGAIEGRAA